MPKRPRPNRWADGHTSIDPEDYEVIDEHGERIGRIYRAEAVGGGHVWRWFVYILAVDNVPPAGRHRGRRPWRHSNSKNSDP
jgi:hypothetical protein